MTQFLNGTDPSLRLTRAATVDTFTAGVGFTAGSSTSISLSNDPGSENNVIISFDGIVQHRTEYSVSGTTVTFTAAIPAAVAAIEATYTTTVPANEPADNSVTNAKIADDAVGLAELSATGTPSSSNFLRGDNAWAEAGGGAWTLIGSQVGDGGSSITQTGLDASTYDAFGIIFTGMRPSSDDVTPQIQFGDSSGIDSGGSDYSFSCAQFPSGNGSTFVREGSVSSATIDLEGQDATTDRVGNSTGEGWSANATLHIGSTSMYPHIHGTGFYRTAQPFPRTAVFSGSRLSQIVVDRILFKFSGGNVAAGRMTTYGIKHS